MGHAESDRDRSTVPIHPVWESPVFASVWNVIKIFFKQIYDILSIKYFLKKSVLFIQYVFQFGCNHFQQRRQMERAT